MNIKLENIDGQVCKLNNEKLEIFHVLPDSGIEGFAHEFLDDIEADPEYYSDMDLEYMKDCGIIAREE